MSSHLSPRCLTWWLCSPQKGWPLVGAGSQSHALLPWLLCGATSGENLPRLSSRFIPLSPIFVVLANTRMVRQPEQRGHPQCQASPHSRRQRPTRCHQPFADAAAPCVACKTARMTCAASFSNCSSPGDFSTLRGPFFQTPPLPEPPTCRNPFPSLPRPESGLLGCSPKPSSNSRHLAESLFPHQATTPGPCPPWRALFPLP